MKKLENYSNSIPFKVPENYFDGFEEKLKEKIEKKPANNKFERQISSIKPYLAIAAGFLLIFALWGILLKQFNKDNSGDAINTTQYSETIYLESVSSDEMIEMLTKENTGSLDIDLNLNDDVDMVIEELEISDIMDAI